MLFWTCFVKEGSFIRATLVWTTNLIVKKCFLPRPKSCQFNLQVSRRFFISCLYSRYVEIYLLTWRRRHFFYKIPQALARLWPSHDATRACGGGRTKTIETRLELTPNSSILTSIFGLWFSLQVYMEVSGWSPYICSGTPPCITRLPPPVDLPVILVFTVH
jgi:hypothetical protein